MDSGEESTVTVTNWPGLSFPIPAGPAHERPMHAWACMGGTRCSVRRPLLSVEFSGWFMKPEAQAHWEVSLMEWELAGALDVRVIANRH